MPRQAAHYRIVARGEVFQVRFTRESKEHRLSTGRGDKPTAEEEAKKLVRDHDANPGACQFCRTTKAAGGALAGLGDEWLKALKKTHSAGYGKRATTDLDYIEAKFADVSEITSKAWEAWKPELHSTKTERREFLTWGSIANLANTVRAFLRWCATEGHIESVPEIKNPTVKQLAADRAYLRPLDVDEQQMFLWCLAIYGEARALRIYIALFETWMRKGACEVMTPRWISFEQQTIRIPSKHTKAQRGDLVIDLTPRAAEAIHEEMGDVVDLDRPVFGDFDYRALFATTIERAGIDDLGLTAHHVTRRTAATIAGAKPGASLAGMKAQGGWRSSAVVDMYMRPTLDAARKVTR